MVREVNNDYMVGLTDTFPSHRKGATGDVAKLNCASCHQGAYKPLYGAEMAKEFPELLSYIKTDAGPSLAAVYVRPARWRLRKAVEVLCELQPNSAGQDQLGEHAQVLNGLHRFCGAR